MIRTTIWTLIVACLCCGQKVTAQELIAEKWTPKLGMELTSELQGTSSGDYNYVNLLRLNAALPIVSPRSESPRTTGLTFEIASLSTSMTARESIGGDLQTFSNLDAGNIPFALSVCDLVLNVGDRHSLSLGIRNMNEDYFCSPVTSFFTNSSCGIYPTLSANYPIANYPLASMGAHYRYEHRCSEGDEADAIVLQASLYNGMGYRRFAGRENVFRFCPKGDGVYGLTELQYQYQGSHYFLGNATYYNRGREALKSNRTSFSPWFYAEQRITSRLHLLLGYSHSFLEEEEGNAEALCRDFAGLGAHYQLTKLALGIFTDYARFGKTNEWATELSCRWSPNRYFSIQPTAHFIMTGSQCTGAFSLRLHAAI